MSSLQSVCKGKYLLALLVGFLLAAPAWAATPEDTADRAIAALDRMMHAPDHEMPADMLRNAYAVVVLPSVMRAGLVIGGQRGQGLLAVKGQDGWSDPVFVSFSGGSLGLQAGVSSTDVLLIFRSADGVQTLVDGKFLLGTDLAVAAGPVGRNAQAATDVGLKAEVFAWSRSRGLFAGFSLQGASLKVNRDAITDFYGDKVDAEAVLAGEVENPPAVLTRFRERLTEYTEH